MVSSGAVYHTNGPIYKTYYIIINRRLTNEEKTAKKQSKPSEANM